MSYPYQIKSFEEYKQVYKKSIEQPEIFWAEIAEHFTWKKKWDEVLNWNFTEPKIEWFKGAKLNITENCLDRHLEKNGDTAAIIWEPNNPNETSVTLSYKELHLQVCLFAQVLKNNGVANTIIKISKEIAVKGSCETLASLVNNFGLIELLLLILVEVFLISNETIAQIVTNK